MFYHSPIHSEYQTPLCDVGLFECARGGLERFVDRVVKARFFQVENFNSAQATFFDCLQQLWSAANRAEYEDIGHGVKVRLERFAPRLDDDGFVEGEFVRQQEDNVPPIAVDGAPLAGSDDPIGHRCAFRYLPIHNVLLLESRREAVTPSRVNGLMKNRVRRHSGFFISPLLSETALQRLQAGTPRKVRIRVARPADVGQVEGDPLDIEENLGRFQNILGAPNIEVSASFPNTDRDGSLHWGGLNKLINWATGNRGHVEHLSVKILEESEPIDIFSEQIKIQDILELDNTDVEAHYEARRDFLKVGFRDYLPVIERIYAR